LRQTVVVIAELVAVSTFVQPAGAVRVAALAEVAMSSSPLPVWTAAGTVTDSEVALPLAVADPTKAIEPGGGGGPALTVICWVEVFVAAAVLVTFSATE
jgi:hypothetical protein